MDLFAFHKNAYLTKHRQMLIQTLFYELLITLRKETKKQYIKECLKPKYSENDLDNIESSTAPIKINIH